MNEFYGSLGELRQGGSFHPCADVLASMHFELAICLQSHASDMLVEPQRQSQHLDFLFLLTLMGMPSEIPLCWKLPQLAGYCFLTRV